MKRIAASVTWPAAMGLLVVALGLSQASIRSVAPSTVRGRVTYAKDIAPILNQNCAVCHRDGQVAPFALTSYEDAHKRAKLIAAVTGSRYMPPWKAAPNFGHFTDERRLSASQIRLIQAWASAGAPEGNPADLPPAPSYPSGWTLGTPDVALQPDASYALAADGNDVYRCFVIPTNYPEDRWLSGMEVRPGNRQVVHHVIAYLDTSGKARELAAAAHDGNPGYTSFGGPGFTPAGALGGWAPGYNAAMLPPGQGIFLPKGADIVLQVHYHKDGKPETDLTRIALYFSRAPVDKRVRTLPIINPFLDIPAGDAQYTAKAGMTIPEDITVSDIMPHMHLLGRDMTVTATLPSGQVVPMVKVTHWDFNWQTKYVYAQPIKLPKGTKIALVAHYDNTSENPRNPNSPPKPVIWGEQTTDEMCISFLGYTVDSEHLTQGQTANVGPEFSQASRDANMAALMSQFDKDGDGKLNAAELTSLITFFQQQARERQPNSGLQSIAPAQAVSLMLSVFDKDGDGKLNQEELINALRVLRSRGVVSGRTF